MKIAYIPTAVLALFLVGIVSDAGAFQDIRRGSGTGAAIAAPRKPKKVISIKRVPTGPGPVKPPPATANAKKAELHYKTGSDLLEAGKTEPAITEFEAAIRLNSKHAEAWAGLGNALFNKLDIDGAVNAWQRAVTLDPTYYQARTNIANASFARRDYDRAATEYGALMKQMPNYADAILGYANSLVQLRRYDEAVPVFVRAIEASGGKNYEAKLMLAQLHMFLKEPAKAESYAKETIAELGNDNAETSPAWSILGYLNYEKGDMKAADEAFAQAVKLCGGCPSDELAQLYFNRSLTLEMSGNKMEAAKALDQYLRLAPFVDNIAEHQKRLERLRQP